MGQFTFLWRAVIFAWGGRARTISASLLDAQCAALEIGAVELSNGCFGLLGGSKFDEAKATRVVRVRIAHDVSILDLSKLFESMDELVIANARGNASDEEVGARILGARVGDIASRVLRGSTCSS